METHSVSLPGTSQGQRSLADYSPWGHKESGTTEGLKQQQISDMERQYLLSKQKLKIHKRKMLLSSLGQITTLLKYKCERYGKELKKIERYYPSSQICSHCGKTCRVGRSETYRCPHCKLIIDRDYNAAINILNYGIAHN